MPQHSLIINSPFSVPSQHWRFVAHETPLDLEEGRREAGYMVSDPKEAKPHRDIGRFVPLPLVNKIRKRVDAWRDSSYPGITGVTKALLEHWKDDGQRDFPFFFCQIEAIETLIWLIETTEAEQSGIEIPSDGGEFKRLCAKLATGTGKTVVMAMLIAWQVINRATYPQDKRFSQNIFIVTPNLTVRERLAVLVPSHTNNYYDEFGIVPLSLNEKLRQAKILIRNWHILNWESEEKISKKKSVDKRGVRSDEAYTRDVLGELAATRNLIVINDEAHHAWRVPAQANMTGVGKEEIEEATKWIGGLDRIHKTRGILNCFDFSATPFAPSGKTTSEEALFGWIVSDFGLNDAIESGLVKTPRIVVREDALTDTKSFKPRLYHIYNDQKVKKDLNREAGPHEPLPTLVINAYMLLGLDWQETNKIWTARQAKTPPVMITVANRTETAARIKHAFDNNDIKVPPLRDSEGILHIDSKVLKQAEAGSEAGTRTKKEEAEALREKVNTVGQADKPGGPVQNVISVGMLSEGWDARTVTHIMGLRAFTSQLLCEQVIGRGLRRASYETNSDDLFDPEYVNVFGVPFSFLPHEEQGEPPPPPEPRILIQPIDAKRQFEISWPQVLRIERTYKSELSVDWKKVSELQIDTSEIVEIAEIAPTVDSQPDVSKVKDIDIVKLMETSRQQTLTFKAAQTVWKERQPSWPGSPAVLMAELVRLAEQFLDSDRINIFPAIYNQDKKRRHLVIMLSMPNVIRHFWQAIDFNNTEKTSLVLDSNHPIRATGDMRPWRTSKPYGAANKSHINYCVYDSTWEASEAFELDRNKSVTAWVKNDHLGFDVLYIHDGVVHKYRPDFLIRMKSGKMLVLETKGQQTEQDNSKHRFMKEWAQAVSEDGRFGQWLFDVSTRPADIKDILAAANASNNNS